MAVHTGGQQGSGESETGRSGLVSNLHHTGQSLCPADDLIGSRGDSERFHLTRIVIHSARPHRPGVNIKPDNSCDS